MLTYFTYLLFQRNINMVVYSRRIISLLNGIQNNARPFDEILFSFDSTTNSTALDCFDSKSVKNLLTWMLLLFLPRWLMNSNSYLSMWDIYTSWDSGRSADNTRDDTWHGFKRHFSHYIYSIVYFCFQIHKIIKKTNVTEKLIDSTFRLFDWTCLLTMKY